LGIQFLDELRALQRKQKIKEKFGCKNKGYLIFLFNIYNFFNVIVMAKTSFFIIYIFGWDLGLFNIFSNLGLKVMAWDGTTVQSLRSKP